MTESRTIPVLMTLAEVAAALGIGQSTVRKNNGKGGFPASRHIGGSVRWDADEVAEYARTGRS